MTPILKKTGLRKIESRFRDLITYWEITVQKTIVAPL